MVQPAVARFAALFFVVAMLAPSLAPTVLAAATNPTPAPDVILVADTPRGIATALAPLTYAGRYDVTFTNLTGAIVNENAQLFRPNGTSAVNAQQAYPDGAHGAGHANVTFPSVIFDTAGTWTLRTTSGTTLKFDVLPANWLYVLPSSTGMPFREDGAMPFAITVSDASQRPAAGARLSAWWLPANATTGANGQYLTMLEAMPVGTHAVVAHLDRSGDGTSDLRGNVTFQVAPAFATIYDWGGARALGNNPQAFDITTPTGHPLIAGRAPPVWYRLAVTLPSGQTLAYAGNVTGATPDVDVSDAIAGAPQDLVWRYNTSRGGFEFRPGAVWEPGPYLFAFKMNVKTSPGEPIEGLAAPEYMASWSIYLSNETTPFVDVFDASGRSISYLDVPAPVGDGNFRKAGEHKLTLYVRDANATIPRTTPTIKVTGDILPTWTVASYDAQNGIATLVGVSPTRVGGNVIIDTSWNGTFVRRSIPISPGSIATIHQQTLDAGTHAYVDVHLRDMFGNPIVAGRVELLSLGGGDYPGIGRAIINGTGAPGAGQAGIYTFRVRPDEVGTLLAAASDLNDNHSYALVPVIAGEHHYDARISPTIVPAGREETFTVWAWDETGAAAPERFVQLCPDNAGPSPPGVTACSATAWTDANGSATLQFKPSPGIYRIFLDGNSTSATLRAFGTLLVKAPQETFEGKSIVVRVMRADTAGPAAGARVIIERDGLVIVNTTLGADGTLTLARPEVGHHSLRVALPHYLTAFHEFDVLRVPTVALDDAEGSTLLPGIAQLVLRDSPDFHRGTFRIHYDASIVDVRSVKALEEANDRVTTWRVDAARGTIDIHVLMDGSVRGNVPLVALELAAQPGVFGETSPLRVSVVELEGQRLAALPSNVESGSFHAVLVGGGVGDAVAEFVERHV